LQILLTFSTFAETKVESTEKKLSFDCTILISI